MRITLEDRISLPTQRQFTDSGQMIVPCKFARTGSQIYTADQLGLEGGSKLVEVHREETQVFDEVSMASFRSVPVTDGHPKSGLVTAETASDFQVGMLEGLPTRDEDTLSGTLVITHQDAIDSIEDGNIELSAGYTCKLEMRDSQYFQTEIRANHIAIVPKGRAGSVCSIADEEVTMTPEELKAKEAADAAATKLADAAAAEEAAAAELVAYEAKPEVPLEVQLADAVAALEVLQAKFDEAQEAASAKLALADTALVDAVEERVNVVLSALDMTDMEVADFAGKSVQEIKHSVVATIKPDLSLEDRSDAYVAARFDVLAEDSGAGETPMGRLLSENAAASHVEVKASTVVTDARAAMIARSKAGK